MPLSVGDKLGPYEILAPIGAGGMGELWKARDTGLNRVVAIKRLKGEHTARFQQDARAVAALNHPHICQLYDIGPDHLVLDTSRAMRLRRMSSICCPFRISARHQGKSHNCAHLVLHLISG
jgi:eukaryotic-like serine/threonine-protein kinase